MNERFDDEQARAVFARAAQLQESSSSALAKRESGYSLTDLQEIAGEAGIDPEHVLAAVREMSVARDAPSRLRFAGIPERLSLERRVPSRLTDREWEAMVRTMRKTFQRTGRATRFGDIREWVSGATTEMVQLRLESDETGTDIQLRQSMKSWDQMTFAFGAAFGLGAVLFALLMGLFDLPGSPWGLPLGFGAAAVAAMVVTRAAARLAFRRQNLKFEAAMDRLALIAVSDEKE